MDERILYTLKRRLPPSLANRLPRVIRVVAVSLRQARALNSRYRGRHAPANVLSFRYGPDYGEILICPPLIRREARREGNSSRFQMTWMVLHGMLHLSGVHHERSRDTAARVTRLEKRILGALFGARRGN